MSTRLFFVPPLSLEFAAQPSQGDGENPRRYGKTPTKQESLDELEQNNCDRRAEQEANDRLPIICDMNSIRGGRSLDKVGYSVRRTASATCEPG